MRPERPGWLRALWSDLRQSTDANLLGVPRFLGLLYGPIEHRLRIDEALAAMLRRRLAPHVSWRHAFGGLVYLLFMVLVVTGVLLAVYYRPSPEEAYASLQHITTTVPLGWLVRDLHVWSASLIVLLGLIHMGRVFLDRAYGSPRETNWLAGVLLLFVILAFGATGYLLPWDQWAYWTVAELLNAVRAVPVLGPVAANLLTGDAAVSGATLSRYFALHVIVLPWVAFWLLALHFALVRKHGVAPPARGLPKADQGVPFYPHHLLRSFTAAVLLLASTATLAILFPRALSPPANPFAPPESIELTWVPVSVSLALVRFAGWWGLAAFTGLGAILALVPVFERDGEVAFRRRPVAAALAVAFAVVFAAAWAGGQTIRTPSPDLRPVLAEPASGAAAVTTPLPPPPGGEP